MIWPISTANNYGDNNWLLYDADGNANITDTQESSEAVARPDVAYQNFCVECSLDYYGGGFEQTILIPVTPVPLDSPASLAIPQVFHSTPYALT